VVSKFAFKWVNLHRYAAVRFSVGVQGTVRVLLGGEVGGGGCGLNVRRIRRFVPWLHDSGGTVSERLRYFAVKTYTN
jgi:hypothetical protein